jgi:hypothetical protein
VPATAAAAAAAADLNRFSWYMQALVLTAPLLLLLLPECRGSEAATDGHDLLPLQLLHHLLMLLRLRLLHFRQLILLWLLVLVQCAGIVLPSATAAACTARPGCSLVLLSLKHPEGIWV